MSFDRYSGKSFYCREWVFNKIWKSFECEKGNLGITLIGSPGAGKTSVCCELVKPSSNSSKQFAISKKLLAHFFLTPSINSNSFSTLINFIKEVHKQISTSAHLPNFRSKLPTTEEIYLNPDQVFDETIIKPLNLSTSNSFLFILIDGLDDIKSVDKTSIAGSQSLSELLLRFYKAFPAWLKLIVSTRKQGKYFDGFRKIRLDDLRKSHVIRDVQQYILCMLDSNDHLKQQLDRKTAEMLNQLHIKSDGCFLYLEKSLDVVSKGFVPLQEIRDIPSTLNGFYLWLCQKLFSHTRFEKIRPILSLLYSKGGSMSEKEIFENLSCRFNNSLSKEEFIENLELIRNIILVEKLPKNKSIYSVKSALFFEIFHHSFMEWSLDVKYCTQRFLCKLSEGHFSIALSLIKNISLSSSVEKTKDDEMKHNFSIVWHLLKSDLHLEVSTIALLALYSVNAPHNSQLPAYDSLANNDTLLSQNVLEILKMAGLADDAGKFDIMTSSFSKGIVAHTAALQDFFASDLDDASTKMIIPSSKRVTDASNSLASAAFQGNHQLVQLLLEASGNAFLEHVDAKTGQTPLMLASRQGHHEIVQALINSGADLDKTDFEGWTALKSASWGGHLECVRLLLSAGADPDLTDIGGRSALGAACWCGHDKVVACLLKAGSQIDRQDDDGRSPLMSACYLGHFNVVKLLLATKANPNLTDPDGRTAIFVACSGLGQSASNRFKVVEALLEVGASVTASDVDGITALTVAACEGRSDLCELLLENDADVDWEDVEGRTAIDWAVMMGQTDVVKTLLFWGACVDAIDPVGRTLLGNASQQGSVEVVKLLLDRGLDEMHRDNYGWTALHIAAYEGHNEVVQILVEAGTHVNETDNEGRTPLFLAAQEGHVESASILIEIGMCIVDCKSYDLRTPLMVSAALNRLSVFELLIVIGRADPQKKDVFNRNVIHWLVLENGNNEDCKKMINLILDNFPNMDLNAADDEGQTVLHCCSWLGRWKLCDLLVTRGADVNSVDFEKRTPLLLAAWQNQEDVARVLLKHGSKPGLRALDGASPLAVAVQEGHDAVVRVLLNFSKLKHCFSDRLGVLEKKQSAIPGNGATREALGGESSGCTSGDSAADEEDNNNTSTCGFGVKYRKPSKFSQKQKQIKNETRNEKNEASDTPTTTTTTSGISSMEMTFSNSVNVRPAVTENLSNSFTGGSVPGGHSNKATRSLLDNKALIAAELDSSSSSGEAASGSRNSSGAKNIKEQSLSLKQNSNNSLDFTRELDRLSNPRTRSYRGACYNPSTRSTSDSNRSLNSDNLTNNNNLASILVTRRPNKKKQDKSVGHSFDVCCVGGKGRKNEESEVK